MNGNLVLLKSLEDIGVTQFFGVNGGGIIHIVKYLPPRRFFNLVEYLAGFCPLGYFLATNECAGCFVTTGAAEKLIGIGASDARFYNIPAVYLLPLNSKQALRKSPLQDVGEFGMNILKQYEAEFKDAVILIEHVKDIKPAMAKVQKLCLACRPAFLFFYPDVLSKPTEYEPIKRLQRKRCVANDISGLVSVLNTKSYNNRVILFICKEATIIRVDPNVIAAFVSKVDAKVIYTTNGSAGACQTVDYNIGHILFGGNEESINLWQSIKRSDIVISLGLDVEEYVLNLQSVLPCQFYCLTNLSGAYGQRNDSYQHRVSGQYYQLSGDIESTLQKITNKLSCKQSTNNHMERSDVLLSDHTVYTVDKNKYVDINAFYQLINALWKPDSLGFDDICTAYRDRQAILKQPSKNIKFFSLSQGSAMGGAFALGVGAVIGDGNKKCFVFSGDGCSRYFIGNLSETAKMGLVVFIFSNQVYGIVKSVLSKIIPDVAPANYHHELSGINYQKLSEGMSWDYYRLCPDLSNLTAIMQTAYQASTQSILVEIPCDPNQVIGKNNREGNLSSKRLF